MPEGPLEKSIILFFHDCQKEGQVSVLSTAIFIHVQPQAGLVALPAGVEWSRVQLNGHFNVSLVPVYLDSRNLPNKTFIVTCCLQCLHRASSEYPSCRF